MSSDAVESMSGDGLTIARLTALWERLLRRSPIGIEDDFFDSGGDSALAVAMFAEIKTEMGRDLPITTIYDAPTIAALGALIDGAQEARFSPLALAKPGSGAPPFFIVHGMGGTAMQLLQLGKLIDYSGPVYAIQARGLDGIAPAIDNMDEMADYYLKAIFNIQPEGPYLLAGYSFGGLVAFRMAQLLAEAGRKVALLAFLDSYALPSTWPRPIQLSVRLRRAQSRFVWLLKAPLAEKLAFIRHRLRRGEQAAGSAFVSPVRQWLAPDMLDVPPALQSVQDGLMETLANYRPSAYSGKITFIRPAKAISIFPRSPKIVWGPYAAEIEVLSTPGDHRTLFDAPFAPELANVLSLCLKSALLRSGDERA